MFSVRSNSKLNVGSLNRKIQTEDKRKKHPDSGRGFYRNKTKGRNIQTQADRIFTNKIDLTHKENNLSIS
jgi:hypothetical protein